MLTQKTSLPDFFGNDLMYFVLFGLLAVTLVIVICRVFLFFVSKAFEASCDWLEFKLAGRKARRVLFIANKNQNKSPKAKTDYSTLKTTSQKTRSLNSTRKGRVIDAQNVLRRNAEAYSNRHKN